MDIKTLKALTYVTATAVEELTILQWLGILTSIYKNGIPEEAKFADAINFYAIKFPGFEERSSDDSQESYDRLYDDFMTYITKEIEKDGNDKKEG